MEIFPSTFTVGISKSGEVGKVERVGIELVDTCCGSAIAASNYLKGITDGGAVIKTSIQEFTDFQQGAVQELILPHGKRLSDAGANRMKELPYALFDSQDLSFVRGTVLTLPLLVTGSARWHLTRLGMSMLRLLSLRLRMA